MNKRIVWLDFAKAFTILLVVIVHVLEGVYKTQQYPQMALFSEVSMGLLFMVVMPVFFALSGYVYRPSENWVDLRRRLKKQIINLGVPYIIFSVIYVVLQHSGSQVHNMSTWSDLVHIYAVPIGYLWYLYVLFLVSVVVGVLDVLRVPRTVQFILYIVGLLVSVSGVVQLPYAVNSILMWTLSFYIGYWFKNNSTWLIRKEVLIVSLLIFIVSVYLQMQQGGNWFNTDMMTKQDFIAKLASIPLMLAIFNQIQEQRWVQHFSVYGRYSLIIYLVHAPAASIARVLLMKLGITNYFALIVLMFIIAWGASLVVVRLSQKLSIVQLVFFPYKTVNQWVEKRKTV